MRTLNRAELSASLGTQPDVSKVKIDGKEIFGPFAVISACQRDLRARGWNFEAILLDERAGHILEEELKQITPSRL